MQNKFCKKENLNNEDSVENFFLDRLIRDLKFKDDDIKTKQSIKQLTIGQGRRKEGRYEEILTAKVEPGLAGFDSPVILMDYPVELASLARAKPENRELAERFELYVGGLELANDEVARRFVPAVKEDSAEHGFVGVREGGETMAAALVLFASADNQVPAEPESARLFSQAAAID